MTNSELEEAENGSNHWGLFPLFALEFFKNRVLGQPPREKRFRTSSEGTAQRFPSIHRPGISCIFPRRIIQHRRKRWCLHMHNSFFPSLPCSCSFVPPCLNGTAMATHSSIFARSFRCRTIHRPSRRSVGSLNSPEHRLPAPWIMTSSLAGLSSRRVRAGTMPVSAFDLLFADGEADLRILI